MTRTRSPHEPRPRRSRHAGGGDNARHTGDGGATRVPHAGDHRTRPGAACPTGRFRMLRRQPGAAQQRPRSSSAPRCCEIVHLDECKALRRVDDDPVDADACPVSPFGGARKSLAMSSSHSKNVREDLRVIATGFCNAIQRTSGRGATLSGARRRQQRRDHGRMTVAYNQRTTETGPGRCSQASPSPWRVGRRSAATGRGAA